MICSLMIFCLLPKFPLVGDNVNISAFIKNIGKNSALFSINLYEDTNLDSIPDLFIESISNLNLAVNDSSAYQFNSYNSKHPG